MESVKSTITNTIPEFAGTIVEHAFYPFQVDKRIRDLEWATRDLVALKEDVKTSIEIAERKNSSRTKQVVEWLNKVETIEKESDEIQGNSRKRRRFFWSNYTTSSSAVKKLREIKNLYDQKTTFEVTMDLPPPLAHEMPASSSKSPNLESALHDIKDDVHGVIGIWGMGGVGKTHLLIQINNELCGDRAFEVVLFVTCSKGCSEGKIQNEIIDKLHLDKNGSMEQKQCRIYNFLRERKFVLLLDDLWSRVDLNKIGIPINVVSMCKRKIVLTTRSIEVCGQMEVKKIIRVDVLNWDDAWSLFKEKVTEETINSDPLIQKSAVNVVNELGGLPLALITIGRAMYNKTDPSEWYHAVVLLMQAGLNDIESSCADQSLFYTLRFSYDSLKNDTLKQCFLHCSLWPEDHKILKDSLIELWMGLGLIDESRIQDNYNLGYNYISRLQAVCLLQSDGDYVKMHDVIRDMSLWIINGQGVYMNRFIVQAGTCDKPQEIEVFPNTEKLSFMHNHASEICLSLTSSSTKLSVLLLNDNDLNNSKSLRLELFSKLTILNLSNNGLQVFPVEICNLVHLQLLNLSWNPFIRSVPKELANLTKLKYLELKGVNFTSSKSVLSKLKLLRVLDLSDQIPCFEDYIEIFPTIEDDLQCLSDFQALGITISNMHVFQKFFQTVNVPVRWLNVWNYNESCFPFSSFFQENFQLQNNLYYLTMENMRTVEFVEFERANANRGNCLLWVLERLYFNRMDNMKEVIWKSLDPKDVFPRLQMLKFEGCPKLKRISWVVNLPCIRELWVWGCTIMNQLICINDLESCGIIVSQQSFPFLKKLTLISMPELEIISDPIITFPVLEVLLVNRCKKLKKLPFESSNPPKKLKWIHGSNEWWNNVKMEDGSSKSSLQPFFNETCS